MNTMPNVLSAWEKKDERRMWIADIAAIILNREATEGFVG